MTNEDSFLTEKIFSILKYEEKKFSIKFSVKKSREISKCQFHLLPEKNIEKIAEAGYSDVYLVNKKIYKIIPFILTTEMNFKREIRIFEFLKQENSVVQFYEAKIIFGKYKSSFIKAFNKYEKIHRTENTNPKFYDINLQYGLIVMEFGGISLEKKLDYPFKILKNILYELIKILYCLEFKYEFEHRDLHLGNILITEKFSIKLIDFSLSRLKINNDIIFTDLSKDKNIFSGDENIDIQYNVYREMRDILENKWKQYEPKTNILWMKYVLNKFNENKIYKHFEKLLLIIENINSVSELYYKLKLNK